MSDFVVSIQRCLGLRRSLLPATSPANVIASGDVGSVRRMFLHHRCPLSIILSTMGAIIAFVLGLVLRHIIIATEYHHGLSALGAILLLLGQERALLYHQNGVGSFCNRH